MATRNYRSPWIGSAPPSAVSIHTIALEAQARLPEPLRSQTEHVVIDVADFPPEELADMLGLETPFDLLGIFEGVGRTRYWTPRSNTTRQETLTLFRRAILDYWAENSEPLDEIIAHVVANELGHHYGLKDSEIVEADQSLH